jgi:transcriptional regulator with XRE-family HTH domain
VTVPSCGDTCSQEFSVDWVVASNIGRRLKDLRETMNWSQQDLADLLDRDLSTVAKWEKGSEPPPKSALDRLADEFDWTVSMFVEGGPMPSDVLESEEPEPEPEAPPPEPVERKGRRSAPKASGGSRPAAPKEEGASSQVHSQTIDMRQVHAGWLFDDPETAERRFRKLLRNVEETARAMVGKHAGVPREETKQIQLALCRLAMLLCELAEEPVPSFIHEAQNELIKNAFR